MTDDVSIASFGARYGVLDVLKRDEESVMGWAFDRDEGRPVLVRRLRDGHRTNQEAHERLKAEAAYTDRLDSARCPRAQITTLTDGEPFLRYAHGVGVSLERLLEVLDASGRSLAPGAVTVLVSEVLHAAKAIQRVRPRAIPGASLWGHGEIEPSSIVLGVDGIACIADVRFAACGIRSDPTPIGQLCRAPELGTDPPSGTPSGDVHSVGAVLALAVLGARRLIQADEESLVRAVAKELNERDGEIDDGFGFVLTTALAQRPRERFENCNVMRIALRQCAFLSSEVWQAQVDGLAALATALASDEPPREIPDEIIREFEDLTLLNDAPEPTLASASALTGDTSESVTLDEADQDVIDAMGALGLPTPARGVPPAQVRLLDVSSDDSGITAGAREVLDAVDASALAAEDDPPTLDAAAEVARAAELAALAAEVRAQTQALEAVAGDSHLGTVEYADRVYGVEDPAEAAAVDASQIALPAFEAPRDESEDIGDEGRPAGLITRPVPEVELAAAQIAEEEAAEHRATTGSVPQSEILEAAAATDDGARDLPDSGEAEVSADLAAKMLSEVSHELEVAEALRTAEAESGDLVGFEQAAPTIEAAAIDDEDEAAPPVEAAAIVDDEVDAANTVEAAAIVDDEVDAANTIEAAAIVDDEIDAANTIEAAAIQGVPAEASAELSPALQVANDAEPSHEAIAGDSTQEVPDVESDSAAAWQSAIAGGSSQELPHLEAEAAIAAAAAVSVANDEGAEPTSVVDPDPTLEMPEESALLAASAAARPEVTAITSEPDPTIAEFGGEPTAELPAFDATTGEADLLDANTEPPGVPVLPAAVASSVPPSPSDAFQWQASVPTMEAVITTGVAPVPVPSSDDNLEANQGDEESRALISDDVAEQLLGKAGLEQVPSGIFELTDKMRRGKAADSIVVPLPGSVASDPEDDGLSPFSSNRPRSLSTVGTNPLVPALSERIPDLATGPLLADALDGSEEVVLPEEPRPPNRPRPSSSVGRRPAIERNVSQVGHTGSHHLGVAAAGRLLDGGKPQRSFGSAGVISLEQLDPQVQPNIELAHRTNRPSSIPPRPATLVTAPRQSTRPPPRFESDSSGGRLAFMALTAVVLAVMLLVRAANDRGAEIGAVIGMSDDAVPTPARVTRRTPVRNPVHIEREHLASKEAWAQPVAMAGVVPIEDAAGESAARLSFASSNPMDAAGNWDPRERTEALGTWRFDDQAADRAARLAAAGTAGESVWNATDIADLEDYGEGIRDQSSDDRFGGGPKTFADETNALASSPYIWGGPIIRGPRAGRLIVNVIPWGNVFVDGRPYGYPPVVVRGLRAGPHSVRVERPGFATTEQVVRMEPKEDKSIHVRFRRVGED